MLHTAPPFTVHEDGDRIEVRFKQPSYCGGGLKMLLIVAVAGLGGLFIPETSAFGGLLPHLPLVVAMLLAVVLLVLPGPKPVSVVLQPETVVFNGWVGGPMTATQGERHFPLRAVFFETIPATVWSTHERPGGPFSDLCLREDAGPRHRVTLGWKEPEVHRLARTLADLQARTRR